MRLWRYLTLVYVEKRGGLNFLRNDVCSRSARSSRRVQPADCGHADVFTPRWPSVSYVESEEKGGDSLIDYESPSNDMRCQSFRHCGLTLHSHAGISGRSNIRHDPQRGRRGVRNPQPAISRVKLPSDSVWRRRKFIHYVPLFPAPYRNSFGLRNPRHGHKAISGEPLVFRAVEICPASSNIPITRMEGIPHFSRRENSHCNPDDKSIALEKQAAAICSRC